MKKWPTKKQWRQFFKVLTKKEKIAFFVFLGLFLGSFVFLLVNFYFKNTKLAAAQGGTYIEGVIGQPRFINPVYANSDVDRDLLGLVFSGLMKYDKNLNLVLDLAKDYRIQDDGKTYIFYLKENLVWQDKIPLLADDIIFTIKTIQNPEFKSPQRPNWVGVEVEKIDDLTIRFKLKKPYSAFLENCTLKILPEHIWFQVSAENFPFQAQNLEAIGSGLYKIKEIKKNGAGKIESLFLVQNPYYFGEIPYVSEIKFLFFNTEQELIKEADRGKINGLALSSYYSEDLDEKYKKYLFYMPRYFALFFNQEKSKVLSEKKVRLALNYGTNKQELGQKIVTSPILPDIYDSQGPLENYEFDIEKAKQILEEAGFKDENNDGIREKIIEKKPAFEFKSSLAVGSKGTEVQELQKCLAKFPEIYPEGEVTSYFGSKTKAAVIKFQEKYGLNSTGKIDKNTRTELNEVCFGQPEEILSLTFTLVTVDQAQMTKTAEVLKNQWQKLGVELKIEKYPLFQLEQDFIKPRNYQALLFGEVLGAVPDPFPFWHSSQKNDPGLNLALYENKKADDLLEEIRTSLDPEIRTEKLALFQDVLLEDAPVIFLFSPDYIYLVSKEIKGLESGKITDPSKRFIGIENWHIKTKRTWK